MAELSPAAEAAWEAFNDAAGRVGVFEDYEDALGAALAAVAPYLNHDCQQLMTIAIELEGSND